MKQYKQFFQISEDLRALHSFLIIDTKKKGGRNSPQYIQTHSFHCSDYSVWMEIPKHGISNPNSVISSETIRQKDLKKKKKKDWTVSRGEKKSNKY